MGDNQNYADVTRAANSELVNEYVELDTTFFNDCRHLPSVIMVTAAIKRTFGEDPDRRTIAPRKENSGVWKLETPNVDKYRPTKELIFEGRKIAKVSIRTEKVVVQADGKIQRKQMHDAGDLLVTLRYADSYPLNMVDDEAIMKAIVDLGVGAIKRAPQRQFDRKMNEFTGNKFFILEGVQPDHRNRIPHELTFDVERFGKLSMTLSHRHQLRYCGFCGNTHAAVCEVRQKYDQMKKEKDALMEAGKLTLKICGDSTVRYMNESAVQGDVEAMSGATTGNLLNSLDVDDESPDTQNIVLVAGTNELKTNFTPEEYIFTLEKVRERLSHLNRDEKKNVAIVPPPNSSDEFLSAEAIVKREFFQEHLKELASQGVMVWDNPIDYYEEDFGDHPSKDQTVELCRYIHAKLSSDLGVPMLFNSATDDVVALPNKYWHLTSFYKYGCAACDSKDRNKWYNLCDRCKEAAKTDDVVRKKVEAFSTRLNEVEELENPDLGDVSVSEDDELKCDICDVIFQEVKDIRQHFTDNHPDKEAKFKRALTQRKDDDTKKARRKQLNPSKGLPKDTS